MKECQICGLDVPDEEIIIEHDDFLNQDVLVCSYCNALHFDIYKKIGESNE